MGDNSKFDASLVTELAIAGSSTIGCFIRLNGPASQETIDSLRKIMDDNRDSSVSGLVSFNLQVGRDLGTFHAAPAQIQALSNYRRR